jgi:hypothetical protein
MEIECIPLSNRTATIKRKAGVNFKGMSNFTLCQRDLYTTKAFVKPSHGLKKILKIKKKNVLSSHN